jgi:hypothetical protein
MCGQDILILFLCLGRHFKYALIFELVILIMLLKQDILIEKWIKAFRHSIFRISGRLSRLTNAIYEIAVTF